MVAGLNGLAIQGGEDMPRKIRWGVIGSGGIARRRTIPEGIVPADNAVLSAVYDIDTSANAEAAERFGATAAAGIEDLFNSDCDAVYVATPVWLHHEQVLECARAGKAVLCEKPLGMTVDQAKRMIQACREAGVLLATGFMMRYHSQHQAALRLIREGKLGRPVFARAQLSCWYPPVQGAWRQDPALGGGGSLVDMGGHCIDLLEMFFGPVEAVSCLIGNLVHGYASEDSALANVRFASGALGIVDSFFCLRDESSKNVLELYGSRGGILAKGTIGQGCRGEMTAHLLADEGGYDAQQGRPAGEGVPLVPPPVNMYRAEIESFSQALLDGRSTDESAEAGLRSQKILAACYESARMGRVVSIA
jgi:predicted dehydrogenase